MGKSNSLDEEVRLYEFHKKYMQMHLENIIAIARSNDCVIDNESGRDDLIDPNQTTLNLEE